MSEGPRWKKGKREKGKECRGTHDSYEFFHGPRVEGGPQERNNGLVFGKLFSAGLDVAGKERERGEETKEVDS